jgi:hypothetical protein
MIETWMTYADAADRLGIKLDSVKRRARARRWNRRTRNDGAVEICIPPDALPEPRPDNPDAIRPSDPPSNLLLEALEMLRKTEADAASHKARADALTDQVADLRSDRDRLMSIIEGQSRPARPVVGVGFFDRFFRRG